MSAPTSPVDLYRHSLRLLLDKNIPGWVGLWAENGVMEFPFAPRGWPERLDGKEAIAAYQAMTGWATDHVPFPGAAANQAVQMLLRGVGCWLSRTL